MRIAQLISTYPPYKGGMGNVARHYAKILSEHGHEVTTFTPEYKKITPEELVKTEDYGNTVRLRPLLKYGNAASLIQVFSCLKGFDAVILHYPFFGTAELVFLARALGLFKGKMIIQYHMDVTGLSPLITPLSWPAKIILPGLVRQADLVLSASLDYISESDIKESYKKYKNKFSELPFGTDLKRYCPEGDRIADEPARVQAGKAVKNLLFVGGLDRAHYFKGLPVLLEALKILNDPKIKLRVVGEGELKDDFKRTAVSLGLGNQVQFLGTINYEDLPKYYRSADLFVLPSTTKGEAFGLVLIEAMASGTPVIASGLAGVRKVFRDGLDGLAAEPGSAIDLAEKIKKVLASEDLRKKMGQSARKYAEERYDGEKYGDAFNKIVENCK